MKTRLEIEGMSCEHCVRRVQDALAGLPGVQAVSVSLEDQAAVLTYDPDVRVGAFVEALQEAGYEARVLEDPSRPSS